MAQGGLLAKRQERQMHPRYVASHVSGIVRADRRAHFHRRPSSTDHPRRVGGSLALQDCLVGDETAREDLSGEPRVSEVHIEGVT